MKRHLRERSPRRGQHEIEALIESESRRRQWNSSEVSEARSARVGERSRLVLLSALTLFIELALIRWTSANNVHVGVIPNFVLLASFLGIGIGFLLAQRDFNLFATTPLAIAVLIAFGLLFPADLVTLHGPREFVGFDGHPAIPQQISLPAVFVLAAFVMAGFGQALARSFSRFVPLDAYRLDIAGSIAGIALFSLLSFLSLPPAAWGVLVAIGVLPVLGRVRWWQAISLVGLVAMLLGESLAPHDTWSPYYKITAAPTPGVRNALSVSGNDIPYQTVYPLADLRRLEPFYFFPYRHVGSVALDDVLVIGAGTGNDVGVSLAEGARHVDAVEIDPELVALGKTYNPEHAYESSRVTIHIDDGRAFLQNTAQRYSLIIYALPDSLTALSGQSAPVGLENYLLTQQAIEAAYAHLAAHGTFVMYNYYQQFLLNRYVSTVTDVFGHQPCVELGNSLGNRRQAVLTAQIQGPTARCNTRSLAITRAAAATDDRPFPYLPTPSIPGIYRWVILLVALASLVIVRASTGSLRTVGRYFDLFAMGAAFLLLESKNVVQFALLFGTTWYVNSLVFAAVLVSIYAAVEVTRHIRLPNTVTLFIGLLVALGVAYSIPNSSLLSLPAGLRLIAASALAFAPIFIANLIFAARFRDVASSVTAFGANLLGAIVGGLLEYLSLITGFRFLLFIVAGLYLVAVVFSRRSLDTHRVG